MKKIFGFIILLNVLAFTTYAQNAQSIIDNAVTRVQNSKGVSVSFSLTQKDKLGHVVNTSKGLLKAKGTKYYIKQEGNETFCNGIQIWNYDGKNEVTVTKADYDDDDLSPQQILTGFSQKNFTASLVSSASGVYQVQLMPVDKRKNFKQVILFINKTTGLVTKAVITDKTNNIIDISFGNTSLNVIIPDSQFVFEPAKHPSVEVVNQ